MKTMPNPLDSLKSLEKELHKGLPVAKCRLDPNYIAYLDKPYGQTRISYAKYLKKEVQALAIFVQAEPINGVACFNIGYAVRGTHRGQGLGVEAVNKGINELINGLKTKGAKTFYIEAVVEVTNTYSIDVARAIFSDQGKAITDKPTGKPSLYFEKLITVS